MDYTITELTILVCFSVFLGIVIGVALPTIFHVSPLYIDCGCGVEAEMARQCFASGNLSSWQCGVFK